ncbi:unnamed protein product, partial [marine sediment metagenome]
TGLGTTRILEAIRRSGNKIRFYQASSSEMFGESKPPQNEEKAVLQVCEGLRKYDQYERC